METTTATIRQKRSEFIRLYCTGEYSQRDIAKMIGTSENTVCKWMRELAPASLYKAKHNLTQVLAHLTEPQNYLELHYDVSGVLSSIKRIDKLLRQALKARI